MRDGLAHGIPSFGEYQMGDVKARSCVVIGTCGSVIVIRIPYFRRPPPPPPLGR